MTCCFFRSFHCHRERRAPIVGRKKPGLHLEAHAGWLARRKEPDSTSQHMSALTAAAVRVHSAGVASVVGLYHPRDPSVVPRGFAKVCQQMKWPIEETWQRLSSRELTWWEADNGAYIYKNVGDGQWWLDEPGGSGVYVIVSEDPSPPLSGWRPLSDGAEPTPKIAIEAKED